MATKKTTKKVEKVDKNVCETCNGTGRDKPEQTCPICNGTGVK